MILPTKVCSKCRIEKSISEFGVRHRNPDGLQGYCSECQRKAKDPDKQWANQLWYRYRMRPDEYYKKLTEQGGVCAICHQPEPTGIRLAVDHCDDTKINRGLLCTNCNHGIGCLKHNLDIVEAAIIYIAKYHPKPIVSNRYLIGA